MEHKCEKCGEAAMLCVRDWGYVAPLCEQCLSESKHFLKLPGAQHMERVPDFGLSHAASSA
ncbi:MAG: hypothetical protein ACXW2I_02590 [Burkholderiales bacterium]